MNPAPVRLRLSRARGFNLQTHSLATNGLPAVKITRPGRYGNPFPLSGFSREESLRRFELHARAMVIASPDWFSPLRFKNVACFCRLDQACHGDITLRFAAEAPAPQPEPGEAR